MTSTKKITPTSTTTTTTTPLGTGSPTPTTGSTSGGTPVNTRPPGLFSLYVSYFSLDNLQTSLDVAGCVPVLGEPIDAVNASIHALRGNFGQAGLSAISVIPIAGDYIGKGGKIGAFVFKHGDEVVGATAGAAKHMDDVAKALLDQLEKLQKAQGVRRASLEQLRQLKQAAEGTGDIEKMIQINDSIEHLEMVIDLGDNKINNLLHQLGY